MSDYGTAIEAARLSLSRITYNCDLRSASGLTIPLGAMAEIAVGPVRVLGLIARTQLLDPEVSALGKMIQPRLANPFEFLKRELEWAWLNTESGEALSTLANRHSESLFFAPPDQIALGRAIAREAVSTPIKASSELKRERDYAFLSLMDEAHIEPVGSEIDETSKIKPWMIPQRAAAPARAFA